MELSKLASKLIFKDGMYCSTEASSISYPDDGNGKCFEIEKDSFWFNHRNNLIFSAVKRYNGSNSLFDIGGGNGFVAKKLQDEGIDVALIEPGKIGTSNARKRQLKNIIHSTLEDAEFKASSLDSIGLFDVLEHIEDDSSFLGKLDYYLKDDGIIFITVPAFQWLWTNEDDDTGHYRRYTLKSIKQVAQENGFEILFSSYLFSLLPLPIFFLRSLPSKLGFNKKSHDLEKYKKEHKKRGGLVDQILEKVWKWELKRIEKGKRIFFGSSCFIVAKKPIKNNK